MNPVETSHRPAPQETTARSSPIPRSRSSSPAPKQISRVRAGMQPESPNTVDNPPAPFVLPASTPCNATRVCSGGQSLTTSSTAPIDSARAEAPPASVVGATVAFRADDAVLSQVAKKQQQNGNNKKEEEKHEPAAAAVALPVKTKVPKKKSEEKGDALPELIKGTMSKEELEAKLKSVPAPNMQRLYEQPKLQGIKRMMDLANALYYRAQKYKDAETAKRELYYEFEPLAIQCPGMFDEAIRGTLYSGEVGKVISLFQKAQGDPKSIYEGLNGYVDAKTAEAIKNIEEYKKKTEGPQQSVDNIIKMHEQAKKQQQAGQ